MKQLLYKEFKLTGAVITYFFLLFTLMTFIPSYPLLVSVFFVSMGIFYTFQFAREFNDTVYSVLLPVKKKDIVKAKYLFVVILQLIAFVAYTIFTLIRMFLLKDAAPYAVNILMNPNFAFLGFVLIGFSLFNMIFLNGFFKTGYYIGKPFILFSVAEFLFIAVAESLHFFPGLGLLNDMSGVGLLYQLIVFALGIIIFVASTILAYKQSAKSFNKIDL